MEESERAEFKDLSKIEKERKRGRETIIRSEAEKRDRLFCKFKPLVQRICGAFYKSVKSTGWMFSYFNFSDNETAFLIYKFSVLGQFVRKGPWICVVLTTSGCSRAFGGWETKDGVHIRGGELGTYYKQDLKFGKVTYSSFPLLKFKKYESFIPLGELSEESLVGKLRECFLTLV